MTSEHAFIAHPIFKADSVSLVKDSLRNGRNTPPLIFENLKLVEMMKK